MAIRWASLKTTCSSGNSSVSNPPENPTKFSVSNKYSFVVEPALLVAVTRKLYAVPGSKSPILYRLWNQKNTQIYFNARSANLK